MDAYEALKETVDDLFQQAVEEENAARRIARNEGKE